MKVLDPEEKFKLRLLNEDILQMNLPFTGKWINIGQAADVDVQAAGYGWWKKAFGG